MATLQETVNGRMSFSPESKKAFNLAQDFASKDNRRIGISQLTLGVINQLAVNKTTTESVLIKYGIKIDEFIRNVKALGEIDFKLPKLHENEKPSFSSHANEALVLSPIIAREKGKKDIEPEHVLIAIARYSAAQFRINNPQSDS